MPAPTRYVPRESVPNFGLLIAAGVIVPGASLCAALYALVTFHVPIVGYVTVFAAAGLGLVVGMVVEKAIRVARIRSQTHGLALAVLGGVVAWYVNWVVWLTALMGDVGALGLGLRPLVLARALVELNAMGAWEINGYQPTGLVLWLLWLAEAALIVGASVKLGGESTRSLYERPFCEQCRSWEGPTQTLACLELGDDTAEDLRGWIEAGEWDRIGQRGRGEDEDQALQIVGGSCDCGAVNVLGIERHTHTQAGYGCEILGRDILADEALVTRLCRANQA